MGGDEQKCVPLQSKGMVVMKKRLRNIAFKRSELKFGYFTIRLNLTVVSDLAAAALVS